MNYKHYLILTLLIPTLSCKDDPTGPEMDCHLNDLYGKFSANYWINGALVIDMN